MIYNQTIDHNNVTNIEADSPCKDGLLNTLDKLREISKTNLEDLQKIYYTLTGANEPECVPPTERTSIINDVIGDLELQLIIHEYIIKILNAIGIKS